MKFLKLFIICLCGPSFSCALTELHVSEQDLTVTRGSPATFQLSLTNRSENAVLTLYVNHPDLAFVEPSVINVTGNSGLDSWNIKVVAIEVGHAVVSVNSSNEDIDVSQAYVRLTLQHSAALYLASIVVGWVYFVAWSVSFYPQIYINWKRKSVVGLNFDYLSLNILGFLLYSLFNCGLYWIPEVEQEYLNRHPRGQNPVQINDIVFALHASFATFITIIQCFIYERADQRISVTARVLHSLFALILGVSIILAATELVTWLDFLYYCSYIKLAITLIKYVPQAYMNYKRKSTLGWSIGNIFLDFTGGTLSMLQMLFNAYNYNDWESIFGDPTKFGLGLFSVVFDIFFIVQHYILYRHQGYEVVDGSDNSADVTEDAVSTIGEVHDVRS